MNISKSANQLLLTFHTLKEINTVFNGVFNKEGHKAMGIFLEVNKHPHKSVMVIL